MLESEQKLIRCPDCKALVPEIEGAVHAYFGANAGCWKIFGEILAKEYQDPQYWRVHRLTCDTYAVQHPGKNERRSRQSVNVHLVSLYLILDAKQSFQFATQSLGNLTKYKNDFDWLEPPINPGKMTVLDVIKANSPEDHCNLVREWANCVWLAWNDHHSTIKNITRKYLKI